MKEKAIKKYLEEVDKDCHETWIHIEIRNRRIQEIINESEFTEPELDEIILLNKEIQKKLARIQKLIFKYKM